MGEQESANFLKWCVLSVVALVVVACIFCVITEQFSVYGRHVVVGKYAYHSRSSYHIIVYSGDYGVDEAICVGNGEFGQIDAGDTLLIRQYYKGDKPYYKRLECVYKR